MMDMFIRNLLFYMNYFSPYNILSTSADASFRSIPIQYILIIQITRYASVSFDLIRLVEKNITTSRVATKYHEAKPM